MEVKTQLALLARYSERC